ncbi:MAG TPA: tail fiber protein [Ferruginibacter sp.]|jgi:microcystin-dependent protein|nr:tail fiber protein [Ferruginibacter sp.]
MSLVDPFLSEIRIFSFNFAPQGWAMCNGQLLPINQNQALFSLLGTTYGGNGQTNFALPDLRGRVPMHEGAGFSLGQRGGEEAHTISIGEMPAHTHAVSGSADSPTSATAAGNFFASNTSFTPYSNTVEVAMSPSCVGNAGGSQPHENRSPFLTLNCCIALQGIFPSPN